MLSQVCRLFPGADLYTLIYKPGAGDARIEGMKIHASDLSRLPAVERYYRWLLPVMPAVAGRMDLRDYDLVISLSHCVAKGVRVDPAAAHVCYCFTPMRYIWEKVGDEGRGRLGSLGLWASKPLLRRWDQRTARSVDRFMANSKYVAKRIWRCYGREAEVVYSPVDTDFFTPDRAIGREDWYLVVSALTPYKRVDQAIEACQREGKSLKIIGGGPEAEKLKLLAKHGGGAVEFLGKLPDTDVREHYRRCKALLMPQEEDFGLVPLEAMACGAPVIALGAGGALETVDPGKTGVLYNLPSAQGLAGAMRQFDRASSEFCSDTLVARSREFGTEFFLRHFTNVVRAACEEKRIRFAC